MMHKSLVVHQLPINACSQGASFSKKK